MKNPGPYLRESREKKGLTLQQVSADTNISMRCILALEEEDFENFPGGELYLLGFLRTYADYLGILNDEILKIYRNFQMAEAPVPMQELMQTKKPKTMLFILGVTTVLVLIVGFVGIGIFSIKHLYTQYHKKKTSSRQLGTSTQSRVHLVTEAEIYEGTLSLGDYIKIIVSSKEYFFTPTQIRGVEVIFTWKSENLKGSGGEFLTRLGEEKICPFGQSDGVTVILRVTDVGLSDGRAVSVKIEKIVDFREEVTSGELSPELAVIEQPMDNLLRKDLEIGDFSRRRVLMTMRSPIRIDVNVVFAGNTNFRYLLDKRELHERYYQEGEKLQRNMMSTFKLWTSNAGKTRLKVGFRDVLLGKDGEVVVKNLHWVYNSNNGSYNLVLDETR